ncbi:MgtC/SapB family protein [Nioella aestuarii]|uniref:MgtC/SapB family protein n=1 Tax=Nioella aestuarii TaxID=1662864 RepID=UPI003D7F214B
MNALTAALNMALALVLGAMIGSERQVRQRMAGLRTNALVALGAAAFVVFSSQFADELSPSRVGAQVVSGIGFLGAGIIFRNGFTVHGLNTAATLWCSAAVGLLAGHGSAVHATIAAGFVVFINLGLRPLVKWLKRRTRAGMPLVAESRVTLTCAKSDEAAARRLVLKALMHEGVQVAGMETDAKDDRVELSLSVTIAELSGHSIETLVSPLMLDPIVQGLDWDTQPEA